MSDGSTYPVGHTIITANGIKPSSVMSWIHREKPGSPEWEHRARQRFMEQNGGDWHSASDRIFASLSAPKLRCAFLFFSISHLRVILNMST